MLRRLFWGEIMSTLEDQLKAQIEMLTDDEKAELAHLLLQSLDNDSPDVVAAWRAVLLRRVDDIKKGNVQGKPANEVFLTDTDRESSP